MAKTINEITQAEKLAMLIQLIADKRKQFDNTRTFRCIVGYGSRLDFVTGKLQSLRDAKKGVFTYKEVIQKFADAFGFKYDTAHSIFYSEFNKVIPNYPVFGDRWGDYGKIKAKHAIAFLNAVQDLILKGEFSE